MSTAADVKGDKKTKQDGTPQPRPRAKAKGANGSEKNPAGGAPAAGEASRADGDVSPGARDEVSTASPAVCERG